MRKVPILLRLGQGWNVSRLKLDSFWLNSWMLIQFFNFPTFLTGQTAEKVCQLTLNLEFRCGKWEAEHECTCPYTFGLRLSLCPVDLALFRLFNDAFFASNIRKKMARDFDQSCFYLKTRLKCQSFRLSLLFFFSNDIERFCLFLKKETGSSERALSNKTSPLSAREISSETRRHGPL